MRSVTIDLAAVMAGLVNEMWLAVVAICLGAGLVAVAWPWGPDAAQFDCYQRQKPTAEDSHG